MSWKHQQVALAFFSILLESFPRNALKQGYVNVIHASSNPSAETESLDRCKLSIVLSVFVRGGKFGKASLGRGGAEDHLDIISLVMHKK